MWEASGDGRRGPRKYRVAGTPGSRAERTRPAAGLGPPRRQRSPAGPGCVAGPQRASGGPPSPARRGSLELPAGLQGRIALRQDLEAALEEPHVPIPQEIQPLSLSARQPLIFCGRHAAPEATLTATRKQLAGGAKSTLAGSHGCAVAARTAATARAAYCRPPKSSVEHLVSSP